MSKCIALSAFLVGLSLGAAGPNVFGPNGWLKWDEVTQDVLGQPETVWGYEVAACVPELDLRGHLEEDVTTVPGVLQTAMIEGAKNTREAIKVMESRFTNASEYRFFCRAIDEAGNLSEWCDPWQGKYDNVKPGKPSNFGCATTK